MKITFKHGKSCDGEKPYHVEIGSIREVIRREIERLDKEKTSDAMSYIDRLGELGQAMSHVSPYDVMPMLVAHFAIKAGENLNVPSDSINVNWRVSKDRAIECMKFLQNKIEIKK